MVLRSPAELILNLFSTWGRQVTPLLCPLYPRGKGSFTDCRSGWVCPVVGLDVAGNLAPPEFEHRIVQLVASSYTYCTTLSPFYIYIYIYMVPKHYRSLYS